MKFTNCLAISMAATTIVSLMISSISLTHRFALSTLLLNAGLISAYVVPNIAPPKKAIVKKAVQLYPRYPAGGASATITDDPEIPATSDSTLEPTATGTDSPDPIETGLPDGNSTLPFPDPTGTAEPSATGLPGDGPGGNSTMTHCHHHHHKHHGGKHKPCHTGPKHTKTCTETMNEPTAATNTDGGFPDPTAASTVDPTAEPSIEPTATGTADPTVEPTADATAEPTADPTADGSDPAVTSVTISDAQRQAAIDNLKMRSDKYYY